MLNSPVRVFFLWHQRLKRGGGLIERGLICNFCLKRGGLIERGLIREGGLIELLRYERKFNVPFMTLAGFSLLIRNGFVRLFSSIRSLNEGGALSQQLMLNFEEVDYKTL